MDFKKEAKKAVDALASAPWESEEFYRVYVSQLYYFTKHSTRMLAAAAAHTESQPYYTRLIQHLKEEQGHEQLALTDLKALGGDIQDYPELGITRALWEPQFFKIPKNPTALLGYILALEIAAVEVYSTLLPKLKSWYGERPVSFIRVHSEEDPDHVDKAIEQVAQLSDNERRWVNENFEQSCDVLVCWIDAIKQAAERYQRNRKPNPSTKRAA